MTNSEAGNAGTEPNQPPSNRRRPRTLARWSWITALFSIRRHGTKKILLRAVSGIMLSLLFIAIAIPNVLNAVDRGKQKITMADLAAISTAIGGYAERYGFYPHAERLEELEGVVTPEFIRVIPKADGWGRPYRLRSGRGRCIIQSAGKDGVFEDSPRGGVTSQFESDIVMVNGQFTQWPEGKQD